MWISTIVGLAALLELDQGRCSKAPLLPYIVSHDLHWSPPTVGRLADVTTRLQHNTPLLFDSSHMLACVACCCWGTGWPCVLVRCTSTCQCHPRCLSACHVIVSTLAALSPALAASVCRGCYRQVTCPLCSRKHRLGLVIIAIAFSYWPSVHPSVHRQLFGQTEV